MDVITFSITMVLYYLAVLLVILVIIFCIACAWTAIRNGNRGYKRNVPIIIAVLVFGALASWSFYIHYESDARNAKSYIDTGSMINWPGNYSSFEYNGDTYKTVLDSRFLDDSSVEISMGGNYKKGKPMVNICTAPKDMSKSERMFGFNDAQVVYSVKSALKNKIVEADDAFYSKSGDMKKVEKYYNDLGHYNFYYGNTSDDPHKIKKINFDTDKMKDIICCKTKKEKIFFKDEKTANKNCKEINIMLISKDNCEEGSCKLGQINGNYYLILDKYYDDNSNNKYVIKARRLPTDLGDYISSVLGTGGPIK